MMRVVLEGEIQACDGASAARKHDTECKDTQKPTPRSINTTHVRTHKKETNKQQIKSERLVICAEKPGTGGNAVEKNKGNKRRSERKKKKRDTYHFSYTVEK